MNWQEDKRLLELLERIAVALERLSGVRGHAEGDAEWERSFMAFRELDTALEEKTDARSD